MKNTLFAFLLTSSLLLTSCVTTNEANITENTQIPAELKGVKAKEIWMCFDKSDLIDLSVYGTPAKVLVTAIVEQKQTLGKIHVAGVTYNTSYSVNGFIRRWDFGGKGRDEYAFLIEPDGDGAYYDFTKSKKKVRASLVLECKKK